MEDSKKKYLEGHFLSMWMGIGIAIFSGLGIPLSIATDNFGFIGIGPAIGVAFGLGIGQSIENKYKQEGRIRPLTVSEQNKKKIALTIAFALLILGVLIALLIMFI